MMISREKFNFINNYFLVAILCTIFFRSLCTILIFSFVAFNLWHWKYLSFSKKYLPFLILLGIPFLLELFFMWNNMDSGRMFKPIEKVLSFFIFPFLIMLNAKTISFYKIANAYRMIFSIMMIVLMLRFIIVAPDFVSKYLNGIDLVEMGYVFTQSFGNHAPAVNMHIAFVVMLNLYFLFINFPKKLPLNLLFFTISLLALFIVNTRLSLGSTILGCFIICLSLTYKKYKIKSVYAMLAFFTLTGIILFVAFLSNPYMKEKYSEVTFSNMDKVGRLDEVENPDMVLHNALVTRVSIWKSAIELGNKNTLTGYGSADAKKILVEYFKETDQKFLYKYEFPVHNQFLDYYLKFGVFGLIVLVFLLSVIFIISIYSKNIIGVVFVLNFLLSNLFDDFLIRFDGIVFSAIWFSLIAAYYIQTKKPQYFIKN